MTQQEVKDKIKKLVEKYEEVLRLRQTKKYNEEVTKIGFISPLFSALGWDMENMYEVSMEEHISGDRVTALLGDNVTIKMYDKKDGHRILLPKSMNASHIPIIPEEGDSVQGVVQEITKPTLEQKIDEEVYKLYGLNEDEIKIVEGA